MSKYNRHKNMTSREPLRQHYLVALNTLSIIRGLIGLSLPLLILQNNIRCQMLAFALFIFGAISDYLDGTLARRFSLVTAFGKFIDPAMDKILILGSLSAFAMIKFYSPWWLVPIFIREIGITFIRIGWALEGQVIAAENLGKLKFGSQVTTVLLSFLILILWKFNLATTWIDRLHVLLMISLISALVFTLISGISLCYNNRHLFKTEGFHRFVAAMGVGFLPIAPGTWGSLFGLSIIPLIRWNWGLYFGSVCFLILAGYWAVSKIDLSKDKDPHYVVVDEVVGILITFAGLPLNALSALAGFFLFRFFDVFKPFPIRHIEKLPRYWGILCDDIAAGFYAWGILFLFYLWKGA